MDILWRKPSGEKPSPEGPDIPDMLSMPWYLILSLIFFFEPLI
jgi:hypothetical protein